jgi:hypothetical protein
MLLSSGYNFAIDFYGRVSLTEKVVAPGLDFETGDRTPAILPTC